MDILQPKHIISERLWLLVRGIQSCLQSFHLSRLITKPTKWLCAQWRLRSAWASAQSDQSSLCAQRVAEDPLFLHADSKDSDQIGQMPRLIWDFAEGTVICWFCHEAAHFSFSDSSWPTHIMKISVCGNSLNPKSEDCIFYISLCLAMDINMPSI